MIPGLGGLDPKKMQGMMKQLGISQEDIPAERVIIEKTDNSKIIIENPSVVKMKMQGQENFQITGDVSESQGEAFTEEDIKQVMEKTNCSEEKAQKALESTKGDLAEAIITLSS